MKLKYITKIDYAILNEGEVRPPTAGFARSQEYSVVNYDSNNHILTVKFSSETASSYIFNSSMDSFGQDILIIPDWNYWGPNITMKLNNIKERNSIDTSFIMEIIDENNVFGYRFEINSFDANYSTTKSEITEITYEKTLGALNYQLLFSKLEFQDGSSEIKESIIKLESNHNVNESDNLNRIYAFIFISIFVLSISISLIFNKVKKRKRKTDC